MMGRWATRRDHRMGLTGTTATNQVQHELVIVPALPSQPLNVDPKTVPSGYPSGKPAS